MLMFRHLYFLSHPRADRREVTTTDHYTAVIGPWQRHLEKLGVVIELQKPVGGLLFSPDNVSVTTATGASSSSSFDYIVLATNLQGVQTILNAFKATDDETTTTALQQLQQQVSHLEIAPPYKILRLFFDKALEGPYAEEVVLETPDAAPVNLIAQYHLLEEAPAAWANETGGSVWAKERGVGGGVGGGGGDRRRCTEGGGGGGKGGGGRLQPRNSVETHASNRVWVYFA